MCFGCGRRVSELHEVYEREVLDLSCFEFRTTVVIELYRLRCPDCGIKAEKVEQIVEQGVVQQAARRGCGPGLRGRGGTASGAAIRAGGEHGAIDLRYLERWAAARRRPIRKPLLVNFEQTYLLPLAKDIVAMDIKAFNTDFDKAITGCNTCHAASGFEYIEYALPDKPAAPTRLKGGLTFNATNLQVRLSNILNP